MFIWLITLYIARWYLFTPGGQHVWSIIGQLEAIIYCQVNKTIFQLDVNNNLLTL